VPSCFDVLNSLTNRKKSQAIFKNRYKTKTYNHGIWLNVQREASDRTPKNPLDISNTRQTLTLRTL